MAKGQYQPPKFGSNPILLGLGALAIAFAIGILLPLTQLLNPQVTVKRQFAPLRLHFRLLHLLLFPEPLPMNAPDEPPPPPEQALDIDLSQLDLSLNAGVGNVMSGAFAFKGFAEKSNAMSEMKISSLSELDRKPRLLRKPAVKYPISLKRKKIEVR